MVNDAVLKPVVFLAFANDQGGGEGYLRQLRNEAEQLRDLLEQAGEVCEVVMRERASLKNIVDVFQNPEYKHRIAIFHFGGHANSYQLLLESAEGKAIPANAAGMSKFLSQQRGLHLVFLNGCATGEQAQGLLDVGVKAVIAADRKIKDGAAVNFAARFYQSLTTGYGEDDGLQSAFVAAEGTVQAELGQPRHAYTQPEDAADDTPYTGWPWQLYPASLPPEVAAWNLAKAAKSPYFGLPDLPSGRRLPPQPFLGLNYFHERHAEIFFGRGRQIRTLFQLITDETVSANPIILLYGQSGVGKSSLLAAGLLPRLKQVAEVRYIRREEAGNNLTAALGQALTMSPSPNPSHRKGDSASPSVEPVLSKVERGIEGGQESQNLAARWLAQETDDQPLVIILDQVEEMITRPNGKWEKEMAEFLNAVDSIFGKDVDPWPCGKLILGFRKEWLADIEDRIKARTLPYKTMFLKHLDEEGIKEAITGPATTSRLKAQYELEVTEDLPIAIARNLLADRSSAIAPTLQIILTKLWENATGTPKTFNLDLFDNLRLSHANYLSQLLDQQLRQLARDYPKESARGLVLDLLAYHVTDISTARQRDRDEVQQAYRHVPTDTLTGLVESCKGRYLLVTPAGDVDEESPDATRLSHDTLGPLVRARFDTSQKPGQRAYRLLQNKVTDWQNGAHGTPLDPVDLSIVEKGKDGMRAWDADEQRLIEASQKARGRLRTITRVALGLGIAATITIVVLAIFGLQETTRAQLNLKRFNSTLQNFLVDVKDDPQRNLLLSLEAIKLAEDVDGGTSMKLTNVLIQALSKVKGIVVSDPSRQASTIAVSPSESKWFVFGTDQGELHLFDIGEARLDVKADKLLQAHQNKINLAAISHDNSYLVTADDNGINYVWNLNDLNEPPTQFDGPEQQLKTVVISPDNAWVVAIDSQNSGLHLWHKDDNGWSHSSLLLETKQRGTDATFLAISPNSKWLAVGHINGTISLWPLTKEGVASPPIPIDGEGSIHTFMFISEQKLITGGGTNIIENGKEKGLINIWDISINKPELKDSLTLLKPITFLTNQLEDSADDVFFAGTETGDVFRLYQNPGGELTHQTIIEFPHQAKRNIVTQQINGRLMLTGKEDGVVQLWDLRSTVNGVPTSEVLAQHGAGQIQVQLTPDNRWGFSLGADQIIRAWNPKFVNPSSVPIILGEFEDFAITSDQSLLAAVDRNTIYVWDITKTELEEVAAHKHISFIPFLAFGMQNKHLIIGDNNSIEIIEIATSTSVVSTTLNDGNMVSSIELSDDGRWAIIGTWEGSIYLWDTIQEGPIEIAKLKEYISKVYINTRHQWVGAFSAEDTSFHSWNYDAQSGSRTSQSNCSIDDPDKSVWATSLSVDANWVALGGRTETGDGFIELCNIQTGNSTLKHVANDAVDVISMRSDNKILTTLHRSGTIRVWNMSSDLAFITEFKDETPPELLRPDGTIAQIGSPNYLSFNHNHLVMYDGSSPYSHVSIWDVEAKSLIHRVDFINDIDGLDEFSKSGSSEQWFIAFGVGEGFRGSIVLWPLNMQPLQNIACNVVGRNFTKQEWRFYFPDEDYRVTCEQWPKHPTVN